MRDCKLQQYQQAEQREALHCMILHGSQHKSEHISLKHCSGWPVCMQPRLQGMIPISHGKFADMQRSAVNWPNSVKQCAAICNSLNLVSKQKVVGDQADLAAFHACEARLLVS